MSFTANSNTGLLETGAEVGVAALAIRDNLRLLAARRMTPGYLANYWLTSPGLAPSSAVQSNGTCNTSPIVIPVAGTIAAMGVNVSSAGSTGSVYRFGIYSDSAGFPGALLLDAGTVGTTLTGVATITFDGLSGRPNPLAVAAGRYWLVGVPQGAPTTSPTITVNTGSSPLITASSAINAIVLSSAAYAYGSLVTGALPSNFTASPTSTTSSPRVAVKLA